MLWSNLVFWSSRIFYIWLADFKMYYLLNIQSSPREVFLQSYKASIQFKLHFKIFKTYLHNIIWSNYHEIVKVDTRSGWPGELKEDGRSVLFAHFRMDDMKRSFWLYLLPTSGSLSLAWGTGEHSSENKTILLMIPWCQWLICTLWRNNSRNNNNKHWPSICWMPDIVLII